MKKEDKDFGWFAGSEFFGKASVFFTKVLIVCSVLGLLCSLVRDVKERRAQNSSNKNK